MPKRSFTEQYALDVLVHGQNQVVSYRQLKELGMAPATISYLARTGGPWQRALAGVYLTFSGPPSFTHRVQAALLFAGEDAMVTGMSGLRLYGFGDAASTDDVHVIVPHDRRRTSQGFVRVERTTRLPSPMEVGALGDPALFPCAPVGRAVADACRFVRRKNTVRSLVAEAVQQQWCTIGDLFVELVDGPRRGSALLRAAVFEVHAGIRSAGEAEVRDFFGRHGLPEPLWNPSLYTPDGQFIAVVDGLLEKWMIALEYNSIRHHAAFLDFESTQERQSRIASHHVITLPITGRRLREDEQGLAAEVRRAINNAEGQPRPNLVIGPPPMTVRDLDRAG